MIRASTNAHHRRSPRMLDADHCERDGQYPIVHGQLFLRMTSETRGLIKYATFHNFFSTFLKGPRHSVVGRGFTVIIK